jgi:hypothetical protein
MLLRFHPTIAWDGSQGGWYPIPLPSPSGGGSRSIRLCSSNGPSHPLVSPTAFTVNRSTLNRPISSPWLQVSDARSRDKRQKQPRVWWLAASPFNLGDLPVGADTAAGSVLGVVDLILLCTKF